eukprot:SAG31_NODE_3625_length_4056_cov_1.750126_1_plen_181_part_00
MKHCNASMFSQSTPCPVHVQLASVSRHALCVVVSSRSADQCIIVHSTRYGKYHHEMRWWHQAHFGLWQRPELLQRSDGWYVEMLPNATAYATNQGYKGARWPKMVGPETTFRCNPQSGGAFNAPSVGQTDYSNSSFPLLYHTGPSATGPMLIWQQPHIIWMTEQQVCVRTETLPTATGAT